MSLLCSLGFFVCIFRVKDVKCDFTAFKEPLLLFFREERNYQLHSPLER